MKKDEMKDSWIKASKTFRLDIGNPDMIRRAAERLDRIGVSLLLNLRAHLVKADGQEMVYARTSDPFLAQSQFNELIGKQSGRFNAKIYLIWVAFDSDSLRSIPFGFVSPDGRFLPVRGDGIIPFAEAIVRCEAEILAWREAGLIAKAAGPAPATPKKSRSL